jgi:glutathione S-transferase
LVSLEQALEGGKPYLTGYDFSLADMAYFNEIVNIFSILDYNLDAKVYPNIDKWMKRINDIGPIRVMLIKFYEEL